MSFSRSVFINKKSPGARAPGLDEMETWAHQDSNLERAGYEPAALTVELWARTSLPSRVSRCQTKRARGERLTNGGRGLCGSPFEKRPQLAAPRGMTKLAQRFGLDLPNALACHGETLSDFFQRVLAAVADTEAHLDHLFFAGCQCFEHRFGLLSQIEVDHR